MKAEVIAIGDELTTGQRLDTNSQWISRELAILGIPTGFHTTISDSLDDGVAAFRLAVERADIVIASGGLGPTADDLTRDVLALVAREPLELSAEALVAVEAMFARRAAPMPESNRRQAAVSQDEQDHPKPHGHRAGDRHPDPPAARLGPGSLRSDDIAADWYGAGRRGDLPGLRPAGGAIGDEADVAGDRAADAALAPARRRHDHVSTDQVLWRERARSRRCSPT